MSSDKSDITDLTAVTSRDGTPIAVERVGRGPALACVDAALCTRAQGPGKSLAPRLRQHFTVYTYDRRGRGDSGDTAPYAPEREIEDLAAVIAYAGGEAIVFGHSSGAVIALEAAARGVPIKRLALYEPPFVVDGSRPPVREEWPSELQALIDAGKRGKAIKRFMTEIAAAPPFLSTVMSLTPMWARLKAVAHTLAYDSAIMAPYQKGRALPEHRWSSVGIPTLLLLGGKSPTWIEHGVKALAEAMPHAEMRVLDRQAHMVKPNVTAPALLDFLGVRDASAPHASPSHGLVPGRS